MLLTRTVKKAFAGALVAVAMLASTASTQASTIIYAAVDGGPYTAVAGSLGNTLFAGPFGGFFTGGLTNFQTFGKTAILNSTQIQLTNVDKSAHTISLVFAGDTYLSPTTPPSVFITSTVASSASTGASGLSFQSFVTAGNNLGQGGVLPFPPDSVTLPNLSPTPVQNPTFTGINGSLVNPGLTAVGLMPVLPAPFTIAQKFDFTLAAGGFVQMNASTQLAVPEPASMSILGVGLLGAAGYGIRRRKTQVSA